VIHLRRLLLTLAVVAPFLWFFGPALFTRSSFVFRDAAHYYYPLFEWSSREWAAGRIPLWNPQENCGVPTLADATSSVFYPGKLIFVLPLDFATKYKWYVVGHVLLAAWGVYRLARRWYASPPAAALGAIAYAFSGSVMFQYCNVVFLIGAAWLPLAVLATDRLLVERRWIWVPAVAAIWAMMVLGGDPQAAYHAALLAVLQALFHPAAEIGAAEKRTRPFLASLGRLAMVGLLAAAFCAVQILPSARWSSHSQRAVFESPRSLYEVPALLMRPAELRGKGSIAAGLFGPAKNGGHDEHIYHFSLGPWRLPELIWPNFSGRMFPVHHRWMSAIPAEGRVWTPSIYMGLIPLLLALSSWRLFRGPPQVRWATWTALAATVASFGWYGIGWVIHEFRYGMLAAGPGDVWIGQPVGGLYWFMVTLLPGYAMFRFPAKLFVIATLGLSLLAAWGLDSLQRSPARRLPWFALGLALVSLAGGWATLWMGPLWESWLKNAPGDALFGPLEIDGSLADLRAALMHTAAIGAGFWSLLFYRHGRWGWTVVPLLLIGTVLDLAVAHSWLVPTAPESLWQKPGLSARAILDRHPHPDSIGGFRVFRGTRRGWLPGIWAASGSEDRQVAGLQWDVDTMFPKYHLRSGLSLVESYGTFSSADYVTILRIARRRGWQRPDGVLEPHHAVLDALGTRYLVLPGAVEDAHAQPLPADPDNERATDTSLWVNPRAFPRAWIVHDFEVLPKLRHNTPVELERRTREVWFPGGVARDLRNQAVIEADEPVEPLVAVAPAADEDAEHCRLTSAGAQQVDLDVLMRQPGLLVLSDLYYPGWIAMRVDRQGDEIERLPVFRTNRILRGVRLPAGAHRVSFRYRPLDFYAGAVISTMAWLGVAIAVVLSRRRWMRPSRH
jgi:hypothetical protein